MRTLQELFGLQGQTALVTGASSGLGVEFARALAVAGADVALLARRKERLEQVAEELKALGVRACPVVADLTEEGSPERVVAEVERELGPVGILVNNAGIVSLGKAERQTREQWESALHLNLTVPFLLSQQVAQSMIARGEGGRIINTSSVMGEVASSIFPTVGYNASKGALTNMTRQLAVEWARHRITVNAIAPAWFLTEMNTDPRSGDMLSKHKQRVEMFTPMQRLGEPGELMGALIYLASPAASYVTGEVLHVDGGWLAW